MNEIVATVITAVVSLAGTIITVVLANKSTLAALDKKSELSDAEIKGQIDVIKEEIKTLSDRVEKHNSMVERTYNLESRVAVLEATKAGQVQRGAVVQ